MSGSLVIRCGRCKGYAARNGMVDDFVTMVALDAIFVTLKSISDEEIVDDIVRGLRVTYISVFLKHWW